MNTYIDGQETEKERDIRHKGGIRRQKKKEEEDKTVREIRKKGNQTRIFQRTDFLFKEWIRAFERIFHFPEPDDVDDVVDWTDAWVWRTFTAVVSLKLPLSDDSIIVDDGIKLAVWVWQTPRIGDEVCWSDKFDDSGWRKLKQRIVSSCELETIWNSSNWRRKTRPVCSVNVFIQSEAVWERGSSAAWRSQILILPRNVIVCFFDQK